jgi:hypothetical protein
LKTHNNINVSTLNKWQEIILRIKLIINHITIDYCKGKLYICRVLFTHSLTHSHLLLLYNVLTFCEDEKWKMTTAGDEHCAFSSETEILVETNHYMNSILRFWFWQRSSGIKWYHTDDCVNWTIVESLRVSLLKIEAIFW